MIESNKKRGIFFAILAAALYALNLPLSKIFLDFMPPTLTAGLLYLGAGFGMSFIAALRKMNKTMPTDAKLTKKELPFTLSMIILDIAAPICLYLGLKTTTAANASLLNNFEIVATSIIALAVFKEKIGLKLWSGIILITISCLLLSFEDMSGFKFSYGSLLILLACLLWGFENNCTRMISSKDPLQIVLLKGIFSGLGSICIALLAGENFGPIWCVFALLGVGFVSYGLSIFFYVYAQRTLGAARTSAYYAVSPFISVLLSLAIYRVFPSPVFFIALAVMAAGAFLSLPKKEQTEITLK